MKKVLKGKKLKVEHGIFEKWPMSHTPGKT
jgi:hypothetical protein